MQSFLRDRELGRNMRKESFAQSHQMYRFVVPKYTSYNSAIPHISIRKFSPCGKYLIAFADSQHSVHIYDYTIPTTGTGLPQFQDFFFLRYEKVITGGMETLSFDFCLFTSNKKHMILSSAKPSSNSLQRSPESLNCIAKLDDVTFWVIDLETGTVIWVKIDYREISVPMGLYFPDQSLWSPFI
jgi:hypothetical protein